MLPLVAVPLLHGCGKSGTASCVDPGTLSRGEEQMRKTLSYVDVSASAQRRCDSCQFYSVADAKDCGDCEILAGPVHAQGYCTSWAKRS